ncbi:dUTP diphosphatase [Jeotgalibacillus sp. R-1-5s-1]|uniref:dUTP diphosphatase n=1 Tax=Jeotgalibacillus sp. R-1-5s-1 TaxID=2555897 RepID=UPI001FC8787B|nr:dUTP diphosphatase [Jeotgalibacillus sp. R-1-5s-1]
MMNWTKLYDMQHELDRFIERENNIENQEVTDKKILALLVEAGELANETRCFKFWSKKGPSERSAILEEYVDGIHFLLSIGLDLELRYTEQAEVHSGSDLSDLFLDFYHSVTQFRSYQSQFNYDGMWDRYLKIGTVLGFSVDDVMSAYTDKNEINIKRQQDGY